MSTANAVNRITVERAVERAVLDTKQINLSEHPE